MKIDINVLKQLGEKFGVMPINMIKGAEQAKSQSEKAGAQDEPVLTGNGYTWSDEDSAYHKDNQVIYCIGQKMFLWVWEGQLAVVLKSGSNLVKWIAGDEKYPDGKINTFMKKYTEMTGGASTNVPVVDRGALTGDDDEPIETPPGPVPDRSMTAPPPSEADVIIRQAKKEAGPNLRLHPDRIIDLYTQAKELNPQDKAKVIEFLKTVRTLTGENTIKKSDLTRLIQEITKRIVKQMQKKQVDEMTTTSGGGGSSAGTPGYNVPGAFTNKMNRRDRVEVLGYKMTPDGEKEYNRPGDRKL